jgi:alginate O-acetyltransferase complex protein AlgI
MSFISIEFVALAVLTFGLYYLYPLRRLQVVTLVAASMVFYAWDQWRLLPLLMLTVAVTYFSMRGAIRGNRTVATLGVMGNLLLLCFFKYKFLVIPDPTNLRTASDSLDFLLHLPLPTGISFFVFHNISLIIDYFKYGQDGERPTTTQVLLYILFFPKLVSGPIIRAISFLPQIELKYFKDIPWVQAGQLLITGLFFKLFCANNLAQITSLMAPEVSSNSVAAGGGDKLFMLFVYSFQIYADFFGYTSIALGLALLFGYQLPVNFRLPYTAGSFSDFWNRWHISLLMWLRHYLYIPLGGNRISPVRTYINLMIVMILCGLWHGAALSYAVWGVAHGALLAIERYGAQILERYAPGYHFNAVAKIAYSVIVFVCVSLCWLLFRFEDFSQAAAYFLSILHNPLHFTMSNIWYGLAFLYMLPVLVQHALVGRVAFASGNKVLTGVFFGCLLWLAFAERGADTPFIYFKF